MSDDPLLPDAFTLLARQFGDAPDAKPDLPAPPVTLETVRRFIIPHIARLLDRNPGLLMSILYRVDVLERDVKRVFAQAPADALPAALADLLIDRQLQKIRLRRTYRPPNDVAP